MDSRVRDFVEINEYTSLDKLIADLQGIQNGLVEDSEPQMLLRGDDVFGHRISISFLRELTPEEAECEARYSVVEFQMALAA